MKYKVEVPVFRAMNGSTPRVVWCVEQFGPLDGVRWNIDTTDRTRTYFIFERHDDATLFALKWTGVEPENIAWK